MKERAEDTLELDARQRSADAVVRSVAQRQVRFLRTFDLEVLRVRKDRGVQVGVLQVEQHQVTGGDSDATKLDIGVCITRQAARCRGALRCWQWQLQRRAQNLLYGT